MSRLKEVLRPTWLKVAVTLMVFIGLWVFLGSCSPLEVFGGVGTRRIYPCGLVSRFLEGFSYSSWASWMSLGNLAELVLIYIVVGLVLTVKLGKKK